MRSTRVTAFEQGRAVLASELRALLRDRRALFSAIVLPMLIYPMIFFGQRWLERMSRESLESRTVHVAVDLSRVPDDLSQRFLELLGKETPIEVSHVDATELQEIEPEVLEGRPAAYEKERTAVQHALAVGGDALVVGLVIDDEPRLELRPFFDSANDQSTEALKRIEHARTELFAEFASRKLEATLGLDPARGLEAHAIDVASAADQSGAALGKLLPLIAVLVLLSGGSYAALSAFAGEREGGTLETLLVQPVTARVITGAKFLAVLLVALSTLVFNAASILACIALGIGSLPGMSDATAGGSSASGAALLALGAGRLLGGAFVFLPAAVFLCALLCLTCGRARTFREGQNLLLPLMLLALVPTLLATQGDIKLDLLLASIPLAGPALCLRDVLRGEIALGTIAWMFVANSLWAGLALMQVGRVLDAEKVLSTQGDENEDARRAVQSRSALRYGLVCVFAIYLVGGSLQSWNMLWGLVATLCVLVPGFAWFSARGTAKRAKETMTEALALVVPKPAHVLGAALIAPALFQLARALFAWQQTALPLPSEFGEQTLSVEITGLSLGAKFVLLALLPAMGEELFFRGALYSGLRRDLPLWKCAMWEAVLFGAAHASIYRFLPTGVLGATLTLVVARGRSLVPCIVLHAAYNGLVVLSETWPGLARPELAWLAVPGLACFLVKPRERR